MNPRKILVVLPAKGGSRAVGENLVFALNKMGHPVAVFDCGRYLEAFTRMVNGADSNLVIDLFNQSLVVRALEEKADLVLVVALAPVTPFTVRMIRNAGIRTAHYFCEDLRSRDLWTPIIAVYDHFFVIQKDPWLAECLRHNPNTHTLPNGGPLEALEAQHEAKTFDLVFMGAPYANRIGFFEKLCRLNINFHVFGWGWDKAPISAELKKRIASGPGWFGSEETLTLYRRARIVLNLHSTLTGSEIEEGGDFVNPRAFTVPLCRSLQMADRREALFEFFTEDKDIVCFGSGEELAAKTAYFLAHPEHAERIIDAACRNITANHLLSHRLQGLLEIVFPEQEGPGLKERIRDIKARQADGKPAADDDLVYLLAEEVLLRRSSEEESP